jgi:Ser/Thr protein kinase RdoA (MazF antagonist)
MLRLSEIRRMKESVDAEFRSPVADAVAAAWGIPPGAARWWRSSATHVFVVPGAARRFLRFVPADSDAAARLRRGAELAASFPEVDGLFICRPVADASGAGIATRATELGAMTAVLVEDAPGDPLDATTLTHEQAHRWGRALARFHRHAPPDRAAHRARDRGVTIHGDFELDNLRFTDDAVAVFDFDESRPGSAAADIALATRALRGDEDAPAYPRLFAAFLEGYRSAGELSSEEEASIARHALQYSARRAADDSMLDEGGDPGDPPWQRELYEDIRAANAWHARAALEGGHILEG